MIGANAYHATCKLKKTQVFAVFMKNLDYQVEKEARLETDLRSIVPEKYHDFLDLFSKKTLIYFSFIKNMIIKSY